VVLGLEEDKKMRVDRFKCNNCGSEGQFTEEGWISISPVIVSGRLSANLVGIHIGDGDGIRTTNGDRRFDFCCTQCLLSMIKKIRKDPKAHVPAVRQAEVDDQLCAICKERVGYNYVEMEGGKWVDACGPCLRELEEEDKVVSVAGPVPIDCEGEDGSD
jgi:hypothetical protein